MLISRINRVVAESGTVGATVRLIGRLLSGLGATVDHFGRRFVADRDLELLSSKGVKRMLAGNEALRGRHAGQRVFILGAGASLRDENLHALANETVIAVNETFIYLRELGIRPRYLVVIDEIYYSPDLRRFIEDICAYAFQIGAELFVTPNFLPLVPHIHASVPPYYVIAQLMRSRDLGFDHTKDIDLTLAQPGFETVTHAAVAAAIFMRFREIYLMGCDGAFFLTPNALFDHCYGDSPYHDRVGTVSDLFGEEQPELLQRAAREFQAFRQLARVAAQHDLQLCNAASGGHLEVLPRRRPADIEQQMRR